MDIAVKGEGEATLLEILNFLKGEKDISRVDGIVTRKDGTIIENPPRPFIRDLGSIPFPARDLVDMGIHFRDRYNVRVMAPPRACVVTSRGCPRNCIYCSIHSLWRHTYRMRTADNVVEEIEKLVTD